MSKFIIYIFITIPLSKGQKSKSVTSPLCPIIFGIVISIFLILSFLNTQRIPPPVVYHGNAVYLEFCLRAHDSVVV